MVNGEETESKRTVGGWDGRYPFKRDETELIV